MAKKIIDDVKALNAIREESSDTYKAHVPVATAQNLQEVGKAIANYTPVLNEFTGALVHKIGKQMYSQKQLTNKLGELKSGNIQNANTIEEIYVHMIPKSNFDKEGTTTLARKKPSVSTVYHQQNYEKTYTVSISDQQVRQAFLSTGAVQSIGDMIVNQMYNSSEQDEFKNMKATIKGMDLVPVKSAKPIDSTTGATFLKTLRSLIMKWGEMSKEYNSGGVDQFAKSDECVLLIDIDVLASLDVDVLAHAFNMDKQSFMTKVIPVANAETELGAYAVLMDKKAVVYYDTLLNTETQRNAQGMFTNIHFNIQQMQSTSPYFNAVKFTVA